VAVSNFELARRVAALPPRISSTERLLLHTLILHRNAQTGECFPTFATLAREMGASARTVKYSAARLVTAGLLTVGKRKTMHGDGNAYALNLPAIGATVAPIDGEGSATVAPIAAGNGCNPLPQRVQSTPAIGATVAPEQIRNRVEHERVQLQLHPRMKISKAVVLETAERLGIPRRFAVETADRWELLEWQTTNGIPITLSNVKTLLGQWWNNCDNPRYYETWERWHDD